MNQEKHQKALKVSNKNLAIFIAVFVLVITVSGTALLLLNNGSTSTPSEQQSNDEQEALQQSDDTTDDFSNPPKQSTELKQYPFEELQKQVNKMLVVDQHGDAIKLIKHQEYYNDSLEARMLLILVQEQQGDTASALEAVLDAEKTLGENQAVIQTAARLYEAEGDNEKAVEYYQKYIELIRDTEAERTSPEIPSIEAKIRELEQS